MKLFKQYRRERALARFHVLPEAEWNRTPHSRDRKVNGTYAEYVARKEREWEALTKYL